MKYIVYFVWGFTGLHLGVMAGAWISNIANNRPVPITPGPMWYLLAVSATLFLGVIAAKDS